MDNVLQIGSSALFYMKWAIPRRGEGGGGRGEGTPLNLG